MVAPGPLPHTLKQTLVLNLPPAAHGPVIPHGTRAHAQTWCQRRPHRLQRRAAISAALLHRVVQP